MSAIRRQLSLGELLALAPSVPEPEGPLLRCANQVLGRGRWLREHEESREFGDVEIAVDGADEFSVVLSHDWPAGVSPEEVAELDLKLIEGLVEGFARAFELAQLGCRVRTVQVVHTHGTTARGMWLAASLAVRDVLARATWSLGQTKSPEVA